MKADNAKSFTMTHGKEIFSTNQLLGFIAKIESELENYFKQKNNKEKLKKYKDTMLPIILSVLAKKATGYTLSELSEQTEDNQEDKAWEKGGG